MEIAGGCLCGKVRYRAIGDPVGNFICHCKNCQKQSGSAFSINLIYPKSKFKSEGPLSYYSDSSDAGNPVLRHFCTSCGTPVFSAIPHLPDIIVLKVGTLDDTSSFTPAAEVWCDSKQTWLGFEDSYPAFSTNPPSV